jgi:hypothetical protein
MLQYPSKSESTHLLLVYELIQNELDHIDQEIEAADEVTEHQEPEDVFYDCVLYKVHAHFSYLRFRLEHDLDQQVVPIITIFLKLTHDIFTSMCSFTVTNQNFYTKTTPFKHSPNANLYTYMECIFLANL